MRIRVNGDRARANTLQPDWLPHDKHFIVNARADDNHVARISFIDSQLNCIAVSVFAADILWSIATNSDGDGVDRLFAISGGNYQLTALCGVGGVGIAVVGLDLQR